MKLLVATAMLLAVTTGAARADNENCRKSREYLLGTPGGDIALTPQAYNDLFKICIALPVLLLPVSCYLALIALELPRPASLGGATAAGLVFAILRRSSARRTAIHHG